MRGGWAAVAATCLLAACGGADGADGAGRAALETADTGVLARISRPVERGEAHLVRVMARADSFAFAPAEVRIQPGDVVRFVLVGPLPESVAFDTTGMAPEGTAFLRDRALVRGPLLTRVGQVYEVAFDGAPPGRYPFHSVTRQADGKRGVVVVSAADDA